MTETRPYPQRARERITGSKVLTRLIDHVEGRIELSNSQVNRSNPSTTPAASLKLALDVPWKGPHQDAALCN